MKNYNKLFNGAESNEGEKKLENVKSKSINSENVKTKSVKAERSVEEIPGRKVVHAIVITSGKLNIRVEPSKLSSVMRIADSGDNLLITEYIDETWAKVLILGTEGYVMREFIKED